MKKIGMIVSVLALCGGTAFGDRDDAESFLGFREYRLAGFESRR